MPTGVVRMEVAASVSNHSIVCDFGMFIATRECKSGLASRRKYRSEKMSTRRRFLGYAAATMISARIDRRAWAADAKKRRPHAHPRAHRRESLDGWHWRLSLGQARSECR